MAEKENVRVDSEALQRLRQAVVQKHGKLHGHLGAEATQALIEKAQELEDDE